MTINTIPFSQFADVDLSNDTNMLVGVSADSSGVNFQVAFPLIWTTGTRPASPATGTMGYNSSLGQYEYWNGATWLQFAAGGSGSVNVGSVNELAWYASSGASVSGLTTGNNGILVTNSGGVPTISSTLPSSLTIPTPNILGITNGSNAAAGSVGEYVDSVVNFASRISLADEISANVTTISLTAGDWDVWGNVGFTCSANALQICTAWISSLGATIPDSSLFNQNSAINVASQGVQTPTVRYNLTTTSTIYLSAQSHFTSGTCGACGAIYARRRR